MIDLHCHILPGIDDGAADVEDSVGMAGQGSDDGVEVVCATPHIRHDHDVRIGELPERVAAVNSALRERGVEIDVVLGGEVAETALTGLTDSELRAVSLGGGGRWILLEPAPGPLSDTLGDAVESLRERGFSALIAHPERHLGPDFAERLRDLCLQGALTQVTAALLASGPTREPMVGLARRGLVHVLGSDSHSSRAGRPLRLSEGFAALAGIEALAGRLDWIRTEAPAAILRGEAAEPPFAPRL